MYIKVISVFLFLAGITFIASPYIMMLGPATLRDYVNKEII